MQYERMACCVRFGKGKSFVFWDRRRTRFREGKKAAVYARKPYRFIGIMNREQLGNNS